MSGTTAPEGAPGAPAPDVVIMRALAHPARLALLEHLGDGGPATATECAQVVDLSPSAVSYHLRALARAGLVEEAPGRGDGRERLWRRTSDRFSISIEGSPDLDPEVREARQEMMESLLSRDEVRARRYLGRIDAEPEEWQDLAMFMSSTLVVTAAELKALGTAVQELFGPYRRRSRPEAPPGARQVAAVFRAFPD
jgi:DNA-binding transcriptional ArsR family regulator